MCGISGIVASDQLTAEDRARVPRMRDVIAHRGPDEAGQYFDGHAALGHRRLSIVDLAAGHQPLSNEDGTVWIVFNGEIYNHAEVRPELEAAGHRYRTRSDTETIVHAYEQWGDGCVERLRGMFAFAIWDAPRRRLLLARDRLGIKPLYWAVAGNRLLFGSEIKAILESGLVRAEANESRLPELLSTRYLSGAETLFKGIHRLLPGHTLVFEHGSDHDARSTGTCRPVAATRASRPSRSSDAVAAVPRPARGGRAHPPDGGRAARHVPLGRSRQQRHRRDDGADDRSAAADLLGGVQGARVQRARLRAAGVDGDRAPTRTRSSSTTTTSSARCRG